MTNASPIPIVAIVGRPNVGKSTLFNAIVGRRRAIVGDEPGITRDRIYHDATWRGRPFILVDTGGLLPDEQEQIPQEILKQASVAIAEAETILLVVDSREGYHPLDGDIHRLLQKSGKRFLVLANKVDTPRLESAAFAFYELGAAHIYPVSSEHRNGLDEMLDDLTRDFPIAEAEEPTATGEIHVAVIGRPNVGKSSLVNALVGAERVIVSEVPGTTRDAVDTALEVDGVRYRLIDTAGIRRKGKTHLRAEKLSVVLARKHLEQADIALLLLDPVEGITHMDATIAGYALESGKAILLGVNKADLLPSAGRNADELRAELRRKVRFLDYAPVVFFSAKTGKGVQQLFPLFRKAHEHRHLRVTTGRLNQFFQKMLERRQVGGLSQTNLGVKYLTQVKVAPPTFLLFVKGKRLHFSEERFVVNQIREEFEFYANPVLLRQRGGSQR
jgi:GTP-binding protein